MLINKYKEKVLKEIKLIFFFFFSFFTFLFLSFSFLELKLSDDKEKSSEAKSLRLHNRTRKAASPSECVFLVARNGISCKYVDKQARRRAQLGVRQIDPHELQQARLACGLTLVNSPGML